jgi:gamma-glutamyltranspeptidase/glutathione hydrolase
MLQDGGNAVDAAVATAAALNVLEPMSTGIGGDMFALIWMNDDKKVAALNGSGHSAAAANAEDVKNRGYSQIPREGDDAGFSVSVPGTVDGWATCLEQYGRMTLAEVLQPAIDYATNGYGVSDIISNSWAGNEEKLKNRPSGNEMLKNGRAPKKGEIMHLPELGRSLQTIAEGGREAFYEGETGKKIADYVQETNGWITEQDLADHHSDWDEPISSDYRGVKVYQCPTNGQGIAALMALNIAEGFDIADMGSQSPDAYHHLIESMRLAYADALQYVADPRKVEVPVTGMLDRGYADRRRSGISSEKANNDVTFGKPDPSADTVYLSVIDGEGNACSFINSLFQEFGSGLVVPTTGIALQNRGSLFSLNTRHPNFIHGQQRPFQTIIPAMATRDDEMWLSFGVMGGFMQPQGHLQVVSNMVDHGMDSQAALDALRFNIDVEGDGAVAVEEDMPESTVAELRRRGHRVEVVGGYDRLYFGGGQVISRDAENGVITAGSDPRKDGSAIGW